MIKIFTLLNCQSIVPEGHLKVLQSVRSLGEDISIEFILQYHKNPQQSMINLQTTIKLLEKLLQLGLIYFLILFLSYLLFINLDIQEKILILILKFFEQYSTSIHDHPIHDVLYNTLGKVPYDKNS